MSNSISILLTDVYNNVITINKVLSFKVTKEYYTPYSTLKADVIFPDMSFFLCKKVQLILNGFTIHCGLLDNLILNSTLNYSHATISSKSFTSLLCQNQLEPKLMGNVSLNSLVDDFISIPEVSHEDNSESVNYIFVKNGSTLWDAVVNLNNKINGGHPYICNNNKIMISKKTNPLSVTLTNDSLTDFGYGFDTTKMVSDIHMQDIDGNYNTYNLNNYDVSRFNIVRHKQIDLDRQYLSNPQDALIHKINYSMRGYYFCFGTYYGYSGEDIGDYINFPNSKPNSRVSKLEVTGSKGIVSTKVYAYYDNYISNDTDTTVS